MTHRPIYLDNHSTTPTDPRVLEAMLPYFTTRFGNAASVNHAYGWEASDAVEDAREKLASLLGAASSSELVFTSGATESDNLAIKGSLAALSSRGNHVVSSTIEHKAVLDPLRRLAREGKCSLTLVPPDRDGLICPESVEAAICEQTVLVSIMAANNELGTINPLAEIAQVCRENHVLLHTDASQAVGKIPISVEEIGVDLLSLSGHKFYAPKGIGALYIRRRSVRLQPLVEGGGQEKGLRSGTLPVPLIVGLGEAAQIAEREGPREASRLSGLRDRLHEGISKALSNQGLCLNGHPLKRLPGSLNLSFEGVAGEALMMNLRGVAVSSGAACSSTEPEPSHVLRAIGLGEDLARASLRFGVGRFTTAEEIEEAIRQVSDAILRLRGPFQGSSSAVGTSAPCGSGVGA